MKAVVFTLGCKVNECESDSLIAELTKRGYDVSDSLIPADLYIVNTCAVTAEAEKKSRQMASRIRKLNADAKIIFTGCAVQKDYKPFKEKSSDFVLTGTFSKNKILDLIDKSGVFISPPCTQFEELSFVKTLRTRAYIKVQDGCNNFCSYCIIPYLRGRTRSRNPDSVIEEIITINPTEAVINGINLSAYNYDGINLTGLIKRLKDVDCRIRLGSLEVRVIDDEFLSALKGLKNFAPHFHLSLQSGSEQVLKSMNRHYSPKEYEEKVNLIRKYFPLSAITTDIIVGFPTETEESFLETLNFTERINFADIHPFPFSPRSGTKAYEMKDIASNIKKERLALMLDKKAKMKKNFALKMVGEVVEFLPEEVKDEYVEGYSENYLRLYVKDCPLDGKIKKVKVIEPFKDGAIAQIIKEN